MKKTHAAIVAFGIIASSALVVGCTADSGAEPTASNEAPIINGVETTGYPNVIALYGKKPGEQKGSLCTAELVAPTVLLTAAHCVSPAVVGDGLVFSALTAANLTDQANPSPRVPVSEVHWDSAFNAQQLTNGHDIAVAILAQPITDVPLLKISRSTPTNLTKARLVGYGLNNGQQQTGAGIKRTAEVPIGSISETFVTTGSWGGTTMCNGDSGGPVLATINGEDVIIGVNSYGFIQCLGTGSSTRVDAYLDFIDRWVH